MKILWRQSEKEVKPNHSSEHVYQKGEGQECEINGYNT